MIEQGLVALIQSGVSAISPKVPIGFEVELPPNQLTPAFPLAWTYKTITDEPTHFLDGSDAFTSMEVQIDAHSLGPDFGGPGMAGAIVLAQAIKVVLRDFEQGQLTDPDHTMVFGIHRQGPQVDGFSDVNRSYVRTLEYLVQYATQ